MMRRLFSVGAGLVLASAGMVWASSSSHSVEVRLAEPATLNGKTLAPGDYRFQWTGEMPKVDVKVESGDETVTVAQATVEKRADEAPDRAVVTRETKSGKRVIEEVRVGSKKIALVFPRS
jgi:hypothetical protein